MRNNWALWFHIFAATCGAGLINMWIGRSPIYILYFLISMIVWEIFEFWYESDFSLKKAEITYGSRDQYFYDTLADILYPLIPVIIILW